MQTGMAEVPDATINAVALQKLLICFMAVYQRQILSRAFVYMFHNNEEDNEEGQFGKAVRRGLKYSTLSPNGIAARLRPYILHAYSEGLLTEEECDNDPFALKALSLFPEVHQAWEYAGETGAKKWCMEYVFELLSSSDAVAEEALLGGDMSIGEDHDDEYDGSDNGDADDGNNNHDGNNTHDDDIATGDEDSDEVGQCSCTICEEMRGFDDIDVDAIPAGEGLDAIIINGMKHALKL